MKNFMFILQGDFLVPISQQPDAVVVQIYISNLDYLI